MRRRWKDLEWLCALTSLPVLAKGVLRGDDAMRVLDHGAPAVLIGRPVLWGLANGGEAGARRVFDCCATS